MANEKTIIKIWCRNAVDQKTQTKVVVNGAITENQIEVILDCLLDGKYFYPEQVGIEDVARRSGYGIPLDVDPAFCVLSRDSFEVTTEETISFAILTELTTDQLVLNFIAAKDHWDPSDFKPCVIKLPKTTGENTKIGFLYRDACNYKSWNEAVVRGAITEDQIDTIMDCLESGEYFYPEQVGFTGVNRMLGFGPNPDIDTPWCELERESIELTSESPTFDLDVETLVHNFMEAKDNWNTSDYDEWLAENGVTEEEEELDEESPEYAKKMEGNESSPKFDIVMLEKMVCDYYQLADFEWMVSWLKESDFQIIDFNYEDTELRGIALITFSAYNTFGFDEDEAMQEIEKQFAQMKTEFAHKKVCDICGFHTALACGYTKFDD